MIEYDRIIIGGGIFGVYAAIQSAKKNQKILIIESESGLLEKATYINQARLHNGYHYPRSISTAKKSSKYFRRFFDDFKDCINSDFIQIYAIASNYSWTNGVQFKEFCKRAGIYCEESDLNQYFNENLVEKSFITEEFSFDARLIKEKLVKQLEMFEIDLSLGVKISSITKNDHKFEVYLSNGIIFSTKFILNATYAGVNQIHNLLGYEPLPIKYELCEVILCNVSENIKNIGLTVMDGPFFSIMPFGKSGFHSITTVSKTPHLTSYDKLPTFPCQKQNLNCTPLVSDNCNNCPFAPVSAFEEMKQMAKIYTNNKIDVEYVKSLYTFKPILKASEIDDSRPTLIKKYSSNPDFYTVFSGKLNTIYDLDEVL